MREKYALPEIENDPNSLCIIALGSVGAFEMNVDSDLDLMMIYTDPHCYDQYGIDTQSYYLKLGQRIVSTLTEKSREGTLYHVDMRLRPSGSSGPLVIPAERFKRYQSHEAHIWEQCALTKMTPIYGAPPLLGSLQEHTQSILKKPYDVQKAAYAIIEMRKKLLEGRPAVNVWDVRLVRGGLFDVSFIVQYLILIADNLSTHHIPSNTREQMIILHDLGHLNKTEINIMLESWDLYEYLRHIFAIAKIDIKNMRTISAQVKRLICGIMRIEHFDQAERYLLEIYQKITDLFDKKMCSIIY